MPWSTLAGIGASAAGNIAGSLGSYYFDRKQAKKQEAYQTQMSNTAVQRYAADLDAAGFNRLLATNAGSASTPSGARASAPDVNTPDPMMIINMQAARANISRTRADEELTRQNTRNAAQLGRVLEHDANVVDSYPDQHSGKNKNPRGLNQVLGEAADNVFNRIPDAANFVVDSIENPSSLLDYLRIRKGKFKDVVPTVKPLPRR